MRFRTRSASVLALFIYGVSLLAPLAHDWLHGFPPGCERCCWQHDHSPSFTPGYDSPCNDPTHHHRSHDAESCVLCNAARLWQTVPPSLQTVVVLTIHGHSFPLPLRGFCETTDSSPVAIRGPPALTAS
jgi:hypothetical protein